MSAERSPSHASANGKCSHANERRLRDWCIIDSVWPENNETKARFAFLESHGCRIVTGDAFGIGSQVTLQLQPSVFVLSNLNWRGRQKRIASEACPQEHSYALYYRLLIRVLRDKAPGAHIVVVARRNDKVMEALVGIGMAFLVQPLHISCEHRPIRATPQSDVCAVPPPIAAGGGQIVGVLLATDCSMGPGIIRRDGFHLSSFLASISGSVWFVGEGDGRLAYASAQHVLGLAPQTSATCVPTEDATIDDKDKSCSERTCSHVFESFGELLDRVQRSAQYGNREGCDQAFIASLYWEFLNGLPSTMCSCGRYVSPDSSQYCCRTCEQWPGVYHGPVCNDRYKAIEALSDAGQTQCVPMS